MGSCADAAGSYHYALVVEHADGQPPVRICVSMTAAGTTAQQVIDSVSRQVPYRYVDEGAYGRAVCQVQDEPPGTNFDRGNCLSGSATWSVFCSSPWQRLADGSANSCFTPDGSWQYSSHGISSLQLRDGDAFALKYEGSPARPSAPTGICPTVMGDRHPAPSPTSQPGGTTAPPSIAARPATAPSGPAAVAASGSSPAAAASPDEVSPATAAPAPGPTRSPPVTAVSGPATGKTPAWSRAAGALAAGIAAILLFGALGAQLLLPRLRQ